MALVNIFEMSELPASPSCRKVPWQATQSIGASPSSAFNSGTRAISVQTDTTIYVRVGSAATTIQDYRITSFDTADFIVQPGDKLYWTL